MEPRSKIELPSAFELADIDHLVVLIADMLQRLIEHNDKIPLSPEALTRFHSRSPPTISVLDYLRRIVKYANVERTCLLITLHYIDQICARLPHFTLSSLTCHRFIITALVVASKALCDAFCTNAHYAKVGGIRVGELNVLEKELLSAIDWRLTSTRDVLDAYYINLIRTHSTGAFALAAESTSPALSSYADSDMDSLLSPSPSPRATVAMLEDDVQKNAFGGVGQQQQQQPGIANIVNVKINGDYGVRASVEPQQAGNIEPSAVLFGRATLSPKPSRGPTLEQNMAFEALRKTSASASGSGSVVPMDTSTYAATSTISESSRPPAIEQNGSSVLATYPPIFPSSSASMSASAPASVCAQTTNNLISSSLSSSSSLSIPTEVFPNKSSSSPPTWKRRPSSSSSSPSNLKSPKKRTAVEFLSSNANAGANPATNTGDDPIPIEVLVSEYSPLGINASIHSNSSDNYIGMGPAPLDVDIDNSPRPRTRLRIERDGQCIG